jgi:LDH2 family malate/lactate/ureidoglycolate dehydrogenase
MIPGDPEKRCRQQRLTAGIPVDDALYEKLTAIDDAFADPAAQRIAEG